MSEIRHCAHCGQILPTRRLGVKMTPLKARIFDVIKRAGADGLVGDDLKTIVGLSMTCIKAHVHQINETIEDTGYRISGRGSWRLMPVHRKMVV